MKSAFIRSMAIATLIFVPVVLGACGPAETAVPTATSPAPGASSPADNVSPSRNAPIKDLAQILGSGPTFSGLKATSVTLLIDTKVPVVCAAAYGTTTNYGQLATDSDMAGGPHSNHHPLLGGLQPNTDYHVRVQGVGADGTLYRSQDYTFHTPAAAPGTAKPSGANLALLSGGAHVSGVSSNYGGGGNTGTYGANNAFDGNPSTQWSSNGDGNKAWIELELAKPMHIANIGFWTRTMGASAQILSFRVVADGKTYGPFKLDDADSAHYFPVDFTAQRLRFEAVTTSGGNTGATEIEVYGTP